MKTHPHIKTLIQHQKWRRGDDRPMLDPKEIGIAIAWAIKVCELEQKFIEAEPNASGVIHERLESAIKEGQ